MLLFFKLFNFIPKISSLFFAAIDQENDDQFMKLLPFNLKEQTALGETGLMHAIKNQKLNFAKKLIQSCRLQDTQGRTALMLAAEMNYIEGVQLLLPFESNMTDNNKQPALIYASRNGNLETFQLLFQSEYQYLQQSQVVALKYKQFAIVNEISEILQDKFNYLTSLQLSSYYTNVTDNTNATYAIATVNSSQNMLKSSGTAAGDFFQQKLQDMQTQQEDMQNLTQEQREILEIERLLRGSGIINSTTNTNNADINTNINTSNNIRDTNQPSDHQQLLYINAGKLITLTSQFQLMQENIIEQKQQEIDELNQQIQDIKNTNQETQNQIQEIQKKFKKSQILQKNLENEKNQILKEKNQILKEKIQQNNEFVDLQKTMKKEVNRQIFLQQKMKNEMKMKDENQSQLLITQFQQSNAEINQLKSQFVTEEMKYREQIQNQAIMIKQLQKELIDNQNNIQLQKQFQEQRIDNLEVTNAALKASLIKLQQEINEFNEKERLRLEMSNRQKDNLMLASIKGTQFVNNEEQNEDDISNDDLFKILYQRCPSNLVHAIQLLEAKMK